MVDSTSIVLVKTLTLVGVAFVFGCNVDGTSTDAALRDSGLEDASLLDVTLHEDAGADPTRLLSQLGPMGMRAVVPPPHDTSAPEFLSVFPDEGAIVPPNVIPCARVQDDSPFGNELFVELFVAPPGSAPDAPLARLRAHHAPGPAATFETLGSFDTPHDAFLRYTATDIWGNLAERRVAIRVDPTAPPASCP